MPGSQALAIPQIQKTKNYAQFKLMAGNREVDYNHVKRLKREFQANPHLMPARPVIVNENMFIVEGQHSKMAAQELDIPLFFIVIPGATVADTRNLNTTQKRWTLLNFARSYADSGREDYKIFLDAHRKFPQLAPSILRTCLAGGQLHQLDLDFRRGEFRIDDNAEALKRAANLAAIADQANIKMNAPMAHSFMKLFRNKDFNLDLFMKKLEQEQVQELLRPAASMRQCLRSIEDVYNYKSNTPKRLY